MLKQYILPPETNLNVLKPLVGRSLGKRSPSLVTVEEFDQAGPPPDPEGNRSSLVVSTYSPPAVDLKLGFSAVQRNLRKIPIDVRVTDMTFRHNIARPTARQPKSSTQARTFVRKTDQSETLR